VAVGEVNDAQAAKAECDEFVTEDAAIVGTAVSDAVGHGAKEIAIDNSVSGKEACDTAHFGMFT
jgi:hypothetical protein